MLPAAAVDKLQVLNPDHNMASLIMLKYYFYPKLEKHMLTYSHVFPKKNSKYLKIISNQTKKYFCRKFKFGKFNHCMEHQIYTVIFVQYMNRSSKL